MFYGLIIIFLAWLWQWYKIGKGHRSFDPWFLRLQALGFLIIALDTFKISSWLTWASAGTVLLLLVIVWKVRR